jgi:hypothetical protein
MRNVESSEIDVAEWIKSILPSELWDHYCHLTYAQMTRIPELANYAEQLREADRHWHRAHKSRHIKII